MNTARRLVAILALGPAFILRRERGCSPRHRALAETARRVDGFGASAGGGKAVRSMRQRPGHGRRVSSFPLSWANSAEVG